MLAELIDLSLNQSENELKKITHIGLLDCFDFFPKSEEQKAQLESEAKKLAVLIDENARGNYYKFKKPLKTIFGDLEYFKIRWVDDTKFSYIGAADFIIQDWNDFLKEYSNDKRFSFVEQKASPAYKGFKFQTKTTWACFLDIPIAECF